MSILAIFTGNISKPQYEALRKDIDWERMQPEGEILHAAAFDDDGQIHVADVWESADALQTFVDQRLTPAFAKLELGPPHVDVYPLYNLNAFKSIDAHKVG